MKIGELNGHYFWEPQTGGKAGKRRNKTGTIQLRRLSTSQICKQFRFQNDGGPSRQEALRKAVDYAMSH